MKAVLPVDVDAFVAITKGEDDSRHKATVRGRWDNGVHAIREAGEVVVGFHIVHQVHAKII